MRTAVRHNGQPGTTDLTPAGRAARRTTTLVAITFLAAGVAGFIPGLTTNLDQLEWVGRNTESAAQAELLGLFHISVLHNIVHIGTGLIGLLAATSARMGAGFLLAGGVVYGAVLIYGLAVDQSSDANFLPVNDADNWLHAGLTVGMLTLGLALLSRLSYGRRDGRASRT
jgi:hypothetical protein